MLTENDILRAVASHLRDHGYRVEHELSTGERGVDIEAVDAKTNRRLLVEAKGATSSKPGTRRYGKGFTKNQARSHVSVALYCAAKLRERHAPTGAHVALALPDDPPHRTLIQDVKSALGVLGIAVFFVDANGRVTTLEAHA